jgi:hypothetical protein
VLGGHVKQSPEINVEGVIEQLWRYILGGNAQESVEIYCKAGPERDSISTSRQSVNGVPGIDSLFIG